MVKGEDSSRAELSQTMDQRENRMNVLLIVLPNTILFSLLLFH